MPSSPVTLSKNTTLVESYSSAEIIALYQHEGINVERFFKDTQTVDLYICKDTGYRFFFPDFIFGDDSFYQDLYKNIPGYYHVNRWEHQKTKKNLSPGLKLLEVGCGDGYFLKEVRQICKSVKGLELNSEAVKAAVNQQLDVEEKLIQDFASMHIHEFDIVVSFQVLEHIFDIHSFIAAMIQCIKPGGQLIIAVPNNNPYLFRWNNKHFLNLPPHHAGLWNEMSLRNLSNHFPLIVQSIKHEPLVELKMWYKSQVAHYKKSNKAFGAFLQIIPRQLYKPVLRLLRHQIPGKTIMAVYKVR